MKKISNIILLAALLSGAANAQAADRLKVDDVVLAIGNKATLAIEADFEKNDFIGYQLDITLPKGLSLSLDAGNRPTAVSFTDLDITGSIHTTTETSTTYRFVASKMGNPRLPAGSYTLLTTTIEDDGSLSVDDVVACTITSIKFSDAKQQGTNFDDVPFNVTITNEIVFDENSTSVPEAATGVNIRVKRTILANEWSTICLPFAMTAEQVKAAFGDDVQLGDFSDTESTYDESDNVVGIHITFDDATEIEANHPYIIKVSSPVTEFTVDGVDVDPAEEDALVEVDNGLTGRRRVVYGGMYGTFHAQTTLEEYSLFLNSNKLWYSSGATKMKAFRAYFVLLDVLSAVEEAGARICLSFDSSETSAIREIEGTRQNGRVYNLQGQRVERPRQGLYIKDGKKTIVK